ncbi:MAG: hypothetical protein SWQ30_21725 [Thermodesulfobacteriota bacterium]|nr:hypothetical protein [Thermodesulfobacteriota bacterium]
MISKSYSLKRFVAAVKEMDYLDMVYCAEQEATEAERIAYRAKGGRAGSEEASRRYADRLKGFILFMQYGVRSSRLSYSDFDLFRSFCEEYVTRTQLEARCHSAFQM